MKEEIQATCVKNFISRAASENLRLDGRAFDEFRPIEIHFGKEWGSCQVSFGETMVLAKATCDVQLPKATRPNEGLLHLNVELSPMAAVHFETGPQSDLGVHLNRLLEKFFKESRCVDLESLCIVAEEKVWNVRVDLNVLNSDGNLVGCCSMAALAALMHFRRPDFTLSGEQVVIHSPSEKDPLPISLHHHPVAIAFAVFNNGEQVMVDPTNMEERVSQAQLVLAVNTYRELCGLHLGGTAQAAPALILQCAHKSGGFSNILIDKIKKALDADLKARSEGPVAGLSSCINTDRILSCSQDRDSFVIKSTGRPQVKKMEVEEKPTEEDSDDEVQIIDVGGKSADLLPNRNPNKPPKASDLKPWEPSGKGNSWVEVDQDEVDEEDTGDSGNSKDNDNGNDSDSDIELLKEVTIEDRIVDNIDLDVDSEEEATVTLNSSDINT